MIYEHNLSPGIFKLGPIEPRWYALMYILGFIVVYFMVSKHPKFQALGKTKDDAMDLLTYGFIGVLAGGRIGYILFYNLSYYLQNPAKILVIWEGGMSFHGGLLGTIVGIMLFARSRKIPLLTMLDIVALPAPWGLFFGRMGNFINGELWGKPTDGTWGVRFQEFIPGTSQTQLGPPRHPTQLYEAALEGLLLFALMFLATHLGKRLKPGSVGALFLLGYGLARFTVEFNRLPDAHIGYVYAGWMTMGHVLTLPMIVGGLIMLAFVNRKSAPDFAASLPAAQADSVSDSTPDTPSEAQA